VARYSGPALDRPAVLCDLLEAGLSASIAAIRAGEFQPTPSPFACSGCPALDVVCAGPRLGGSGDWMPEPLLASAQ